MSLQKHRGLVAGSIAQQHRSVCHYSFPCGHGMRLECSERLQSIFVCQSMVPRSLGICFGLDGAQPQQCGSKSNPDLCSYAGVSHLTGLQQLTQLDLAYTNITDSCVHSLQHLTTLLDLNLDSCNITDRCAAEASMPLYLPHNVLCTCLTVFSTPNTTAFVSC